MAAVSPSNSFSISLTDPVFHPPKGERGAAERFFLRFIEDERDLPFVWLSLQIAFLVIPSAVAVTFAPVGWWTWTLVAPAYWALIYLGYTDRFILMMHNVSHRPFFKKPLKGLVAYVPWLLGPFFGETPEGYYSHHVGMHHAENNLPTDLSSTMGYQRDSFLGWLVYFFRFFFLILIELPIYLSKKKRGKMGVKALVGEMFYWSCFALAAWKSWQGAVIVFGVPYVVTRVLMMAGNWGQHAFIDATQPGNSYVNSITCINSRYNRRAFNDGYHIGHHVKANRHWTEMPEDFERSIPRYAKEGSIVFQGVDFFMVWLYLMLGRYDWLANAYVELDGKGRSKEEIIALLKERTKRIPASTSTATSAG